MVALVNGVSGVEIGDGASNNTIGGASDINPITGLLEGRGNVISGNTNAGVFIGGSTANDIQGNYIGTDATGAASVANPASEDGIQFLDGASNNTIGGVSLVDVHGNLSGLGNVISGSGGDGILIADLFGANDPASNNVIQGNDIGTAVNGIHALGNGFNGIQIQSGAIGTTIGGTAPGTGNVISGNGTRNVADSNDGIVIGATFGFGVTTGTLVEGNVIGTDVTGAARGRTPARGLNLRVEAREASPTTRSAAAVPATPSAAC